jgi:2-oxoglutarate dehydrogenase E1 component
MYKTIAKHPTTRAIYAERLLKEGTIAPGEAERMAADFQQNLEREFDGAAGYKPNKADWLEGAWSGLATASGDDRPALEEVCGLAKETREYAVPRRRT